MFSKFGLIMYSCIRSQVWNQFIWLTSSQNSKKRFRSTIYAWTRKGKLLEIRTLTKLINPQITKEENDPEQSFTWKSKTRFRRRKKEWVIWRWKSMLLSLILMPIKIREEEEAIKGEVEEVPEVAGAGEVAEVAVVVEVVAEVEWWCLRQTFNNSLPKQP